MKTLTKKQKEANGENFSRIVDDAAILLQRKGRLCDEYKTGR